MELEGRITILVDGNKTTVELRDEASRVRFARVELTPSEFCQLLSRTVEVDCKIEIAGLEKIGKKLTVDHLIFEMPEDSERSNREEIARRLAVELCPEGWTPDPYFESRDSFLYKDGKTWARAIIRKWE